MIPITSAYECALAALLFNVNSFNMFIEGNFQKHIGDFCLIGKIIKIHSDFYYVKVDENIVECKIREKLKKEKAEIFVGDTVRIEKQASAIAEVLPRTNYLPRPSIANIDQIIVVASLSQPQLDFIQLNRYLCQAKIYNIPAVICINKSDLDKNPQLKQQISNIYENLGYKIVFTSALTGFGIDELKETLKSKVSVLSGMSGVGKSSQLNKIYKGLRLKTKEISQKTSKGTHSTRHVEILEVPCEGGEILQVADTPGFSYLKFDTVMPSVITSLFPEIKELLSGCYFSDCLHLGEEGCNVLANMDKIHSTRYESYKIFTQEALEYKERISTQGHKEENSVKHLDASGKEKKQLVKLGVQARKQSRKTIKQKINSISLLDEVYYNDED